MIHRLAHRLRGTLGEQHGYATIAATGIILAIVGLCLVVATAAGWVLAGHRAHTAADLAAVAGAQAHYRGEPGCDRAGETAVLNQAQLITCRIETGDVLVTVAVRGHQATARAGPI